MLKKAELNKLCIRFSGYGTLIVILQSIPNILWVLFPPNLNRLEGNVSSILFIEYAEHILGVLIVIMLVFVVNTETIGKFPKNKYSTIAFISLAMYWICWVLYFCEIQPLFVIYSMVVLPLVAFFFAGIAEKVYPISLAGVFFFVFHLLVALENYPLV